MPKLLEYFFDRKQQWIILKKHLRSTKEGWGILPQKRSKHNEYQK